MYFSYKSWKKEKKIAEKRTCTILDWYHIIWCSVWQQPTTPFQHMYRTVVTNATDSLCVLILACLPTNYCTDWLTTTRSRTRSACDVSAGLSPTNGRPREWGTAMAAVVMRICGSICVLLLILFNNGPSLLSLSQWSDTRSLDTLCAVWEMNREARNTFKCHI